LEIENSTTAEDLVIPSSYWIDKEKSVRIRPAVNNDLEIGGKWSKSTLYATLTQLKRLISIGAVRNLILIFGYQSY
jgi:hypothetical protein